MDKTLEKNLLFIWVQGTGDMTKQTENLKKQVLTRVIPHSFTGNYNTNFRRF